MSDDNRTLLALLAQRTKPLARFGARAESIASTDDDSFSICSSTDHPYHRVAAAAASFAAPLTQSHHRDTLQQDDLSSDFHDSPDLQRMSVLGPKIHKNGQAPWELGAIDDVAELSDGASSVFGRRPGKSKSKDKQPAKPKGRQRSKTLAESISPVSALKGLGLGVLGSGSTPGSGPSPRRTTPDGRRPSGPGSFVSASSADDDTRSISTATITDGDHNLPGPDLRYASRLPPAPNRTPTPPDTDSRSRSKTLSHIPVDMRYSHASSSSSASTRSANNRADDASPARHLQVDTSHLSTISAEHTFRSSVASERDTYYSDGVESKTHLHPYSHPELRVSPAASAFSDDSNLPSPLNTSSAPLDPPSPRSLVESPSSSTLTESASAETLGSSQHGSARNVHKKKAPPPPLTLRSSPSATSFASAKRYFIKSLSKASTPRDDAESEHFDIDARSRGGDGRGAPDEGEAVAPGPAFYGSKHGNPSVLSVRSTPRSQAPPTLHHESFPPTPITAFAASSRAHSSFDPRPQARLQPGSQSSAPAPVPSSFASATPDPTVDGVPTGMLAFPGSPAYQLISLEQAQAKIRERVRTTSGSVGVGKSGKKKEGSGSAGAAFGGLVARMRMNSESGAATAAESQPLYTQSQETAPPADLWPYPNPAFANSSSTMPSSPVSAGGSTRPALRHRKSAFLKLFTPSSGSGDKSPNIGPPTPIGLTAHGLPSPFSAAQSSPRKPITLRDLSPQPARNSGAPFSSPQRSRNNSGVGPHPMPHPPRQDRSHSSSSTTATTATDSWKNSGEGSYASSVTSASAVPESRPPQGTTTTRRPDRYPQVPQPFVEMASSGEEGSVAGSVTSRRRIDKGDHLLRLRHMSTNFLSTLPSDYLLQMQSEERAGEGSDRTPSLSPATPSFNSIVSMSSMYASSESSLSPLPTPNSMQHLSPPPYLRAYHNQQQLLQQPQQQPQPQQHGHGGGFMPIAEGDDPGSIIVSLQDQLASTRKQMRNQACELERQVRDLKVQVERLKADKVQARYRAATTMMCGECGSCDVVAQVASDAAVAVAVDAESDGERRSLDGVVNRPRIPTGSGTRFGSRLG